MRPYLLFVSGAAGLTGLAFAEGQPAVRMILAFIPLFLSYGFGQALTDCFQTDTDSISSPYRPLTNGMISRKDVLRISLGGLGIGVIILGLLNPAILIFGALSVAGLLGYTSLKRTWWGGPPWNSWIVALLPVMGRLVDANPGVSTIFGLRRLASPAFPTVVIAIFFAYANFVVMGYFKDITADRRTGYRTFQVIFGWVRAAIYSDILALAAAVMTGASIIFVGRFPPLALTAVAAGIAVSVYAQMGIHRTRVESKTHRYIAQTVRAFVLYCAAITITLRPGWITLLIAYYLMFEITLKLRPERSQI
jgi:4-hydroxybenzoate polyprenyltransferase